MTQSQLPDSMVLDKNWRRELFRTRNEKGVFSEPEDLTRVDGVSLELAITLSPHIDWTVPSKENEKLSRNWFCVIFFILSLVVIYPVINGSIFADINWFRNLPYWDWFEFFQVTVNPFGKIFASGSLLFAGFANLTTTRINSRRFLLGSLYFGVLWLVTKSILAFSYFFLIHRMGWNQIFSYGEFWIDWLLLVISVNIALPPLVVFWRPSLRYDKRFSVMFNILNLVIGLIMGLMIWLGRDNTSIWVNLLLLGVGIYLIYIGIVGVRYRANLFDAEYGVLYEGKKQISYKYWLNWINSRLPDPQQQLSLKDALEKAYPPSRGQTITNILLIGIGGWIISTVLSAVVQWFVEKGLENLFH